MKLDQFLKWHNFVSSGGEAKVFIKSGDVKVNGEVDKRRGRKFIKGDKENASIKIMDFFLLLNPGGNNINNLFFEYDNLL